MRQPERIMALVKGPQLREGKTKTVWGVDGQPYLCLLEAKNDVTANDDPGMTRQFATKAASATETACNVFALLGQAGVPVAWIGKADAVTFQAPLCGMLPLELVARRYATGSYLKRHPDVPAKPMVRFPDLRVEAYLKTTKGVCLGADGTVLATMPPDPLLTDGRRVEDPLIEDVHAPEWRLLHSKEPAGRQSVDLGTVPRRAVIGELETDVLTALTRQVFCVLEAAWQRLGCVLIDLKIECGLDHAGRLLVADVIDNDSWRLRGPDGTELSKQRFREGAPLEEVERLYAHVAELSGRLAA